jgi:Gpi18-like mannosyltransferase
LKIKALLEKRLTDLKKQILKRDFLIAIIIGLSIIGVGVFFGWYNNEVVIKNPDISAHYSLEPNNQLSFMSNWDGPDYLKIAKNGYQTVGNTNFFPLYPFLIRLLSHLISSPLDAALIISWLSFIGAIYFYLKIIKHVFDIKDNVEATRGLLFFILFPTAVFFLATYTESLFAFLALGSLYYALQRKYWQSALFALFCTATHVTGIFLLALIVMTLWEQKAKLIEIAGTAVIGSLGLLSYMFYLQHAFHRPLAFITSQKSHGWLTVSSKYSALIGSVDLFSTIFIILLIISVIYWWNKRKSFSVYSLFFLLIPIVGKQFGGFNRYVLMAFPVQLMIYAYARHRKLAYPIIIVFFAISWAYFLFQYAGGYVGG